MEGSEASIPSFKRRMVSGERRGLRVEKKPPVPVRGEVREDEGEDVS